MSKPDQQPRRLTRRERRAQEITEPANRTGNLRNSPPLVTRRGFLMGAVATAVSATGIGAAICEVNRRKAPSFDDRGNIPQQIEKYNGELAGKPDKVMEIGPYITEFGYRILGRALDRDTSHLQTKSAFYYDEEYKKAELNFSGCTNHQNHSDTFIASVGGASDFARYNATAIAYNNGKPNNLAALDVFSLSVHEGHHQLVRIRDLEPALVLLDQEGKLQTITKAKGITFLARKPELDQPGQECFGVAKSNQEEAVIEDSKVRILMDLGYQYNYIIGGPYHPLVNSYRMRVIDRLFGGQFKQLRDLHLNTSFEEFYTLIGEGIKRDREFKTNPLILAADPYELGHKYMLDFIPPIAR